MRQIGLGSCDIRFRHFKIAGGLIAAGSEGLRIDQGDNISGFDHRIEIGMQALDHAGDLRPDLDRNDRIDRSRRGHERNYRSTLNRSGPIADRRFALSVKEDIASDG